MKKIITSLALAITLFTSAQAEIFTGTSVSAGVSNPGSHVRVDQYIGSTNYDWVYAKVGISQENNPEYNAEYFNAYISRDITSAVLGVGFNLLNYKEFFIDASADYYFTLDSTDLIGYTENGATIVGSGTWDTPAFELGAGYSFGSWSLRLDAIYTITMHENKISNGGIITTTEDDNRIYSGFGITYWY